MTTTAAWLPRALRWLFTVMAVICAVLAVAVIAVFIIDPHLPLNSHFGPLKVDISGEPGTLAMWDSKFVFSALKGSTVLSLNDARGLIELLKHYGLPLLFLNVAFMAGVFDLLRRVFRNVGRGESFTQQTLRYMQILGVSLLVFSLVLAAAESWFEYALFNYLAQHAAITIAGNAIHIPASHEIQISSGGSFPFGTPMFFTGLLVLALSEVFRQGMALKREHDLTV